MFMVAMLSKTLHHLQLHTALFSSTISTNQLCKFCYQAPAPVQKPTMRPADRISNTLLNRLRRKVCASAGRPSSLLEVAICYLCRHLTLTNCNRGTPSLSTAHVHFLIILLKAIEHISSACVERQEVSAVDTLIKRHVRVVTCAEYDRAILGKRPMS